MNEETREQKLQWLRIKDFTERGEWVRFADVITQIDVHASLFNIYAKLVILAKLDKSLSCTVHEPGAFHSLPGLHEKATDVYFRILKHGTDTCLFINGIAPGPPDPITLLVYFSQGDEEHEALWQTIRNHLIGDSESALLVAEQPSVVQKQTAKETTLNPVTRYRCTLVRNRVKAQFEKLTPATQSIGLSYASYQKCERQNAFLSPSELEIFLNGSTEQQAWEHEVNQHSAN